MNRIKAVPDIIDDQAFWQDVSARLKLTGMTWARRMALEGVAAAEGLGVVVDFDTVNLQVEQYVRDWLPTMITRVNATTIASVQAAVNTWVSSGLGKRGLPDLVEAIRPVFGHMRATRIAVTEATRVFAEGNRIAAMQDDTIGGLRWDTARDELVCPICQPLDGKLYQIQGTPPIPRHVNCLPGDAFIQACGLQAGYRRFYDGPIVEICTTRRNNLRATPNHPVLTLRGWQPIANIKEGDYVVSSLFNEMRCGPNINHMPSSISEIFDSLAHLGSMQRIDACDYDFHGDGRYTNGEVEIIGPNGQLRDDVDSFIFQPLPQQGLIPSYAIQSLLPINGPSKGFLRRGGAVSAGDMGSLGLVQTLLARHPRPFDRLSRRTTSRYNVMVEQQMPNFLTSDVIRDSQTVLGFSYEVTPDEVISIKWDRFQGHVYNLQTASGAFLANAIITHNCRCSVQPVTYEYIRGHLSDWMGGPLPIEPIQVGAF